MGCIIVTGASKGIGKAIALQLGNKGHSMALVYQNPKNDLSPLIQEIEQAGGKALAIQCDVAQEESVKQMMDEVIQNFGTINALINNAGITKDKLLLRMNASDFDQVLQVNLIGTFNCTKQAARHMMKQKSGAIVNLSSVVSLSGNMGQANYSASKGGVNAFTKTAALELAPYQITVNAVAPGFIDTEMTRKIPSDIQEKMLQTIPLKRMGQPKDVADLVEFLISPKASYITGQILSVNGGMYL